MKFFNRGENVEKLSEEEKKRRAKEFVKALFGDFGKNYLNADYDNINTRGNTRETPSGSEERREVKMEAPKNRDEILLEILKELKEINANVNEILKELKEINANVEDMSARLEKKLDDIYEGG